MKSTFQRLADVLLSTEPKIRSRLVFSWIAIYGYTAGSIVLVLAAHMGMIDARPTYWLLTYIWTGVITFYALVRSGWSRRLQSPGMDFSQCLFALSAMMIGYVFCGPVREGIMSLLALLLIFGVFTLTPRQVVVIGVVSIASLGLVVSAMVFVRPGQFDARAEFLKFMLSAAIMPAISAVAYYVARIRGRVIQQRADLRQALSLLQEVAIRDDMTGLVNRRHMHQLLVAQKERQARTGEAFCVALIDLDHFKHINDQHGHQVGDEVLKDFALAAVSVLRQTDVLARWGGEEFLLMMTGNEPDVAQAEQALDRIRQQLQALNTVPGVAVTFSAGITDHHGDEPLREMLERADRALYQAKAQGRARSIVLTSSSDALPPGTPHMPIQAIPEAEARRL